MVNLLLSPLVLLSGAGLMLALAALPALVNRQAAWNTASRRQYGWIATVALALFLMWVQRHGEATPHQLASWSQSPVLIPPVTIQDTQPGRVLGSGFMAVVLAGFVMPRGGRRDKDGDSASPTRQAGPAALEMDKVLLVATLAVGLVALLPANLFCVALSWAILDLIAGAAWLYTVRPGNNTQWHRVLFSWGAGASATLLLWGATLPLPAAVVRGDLSSLEATGGAGIALTLAILIRLAPFPFHVLGHRALVQGASSSDEGQRGLLLALQMAPAAAGVWLLTQLPGSEALPQLWHQLISALLLTGLVGCGLFAWLSRNALRSMGWILTAQAGVVVLAGLSAGPEAALAEGMVLILAGGVLSLYTRYKNLAIENRIAAAIGVAALAGFPLTWGGDGRLALYQSWLADDSGLNIFLAAGAYLLVVTAAARIVLRPAAAPPDQEERIRAGVALGLPALALLIRSGPFPAPIELPVWLSMAIPLVGGVFLAWSAPSLSPIQERIPRWLPRLMALDWLTSLVNQTGTLIGRAVQAVHQVLEGEGALLWVLIGLALGWMLLTTRPPG